MSRAQRISRLLWVQWAAPCRRGVSDLAGLSHINRNNQPSMVDISSKVNTVRMAHARCFVVLPPILRQVFDAVEDGDQLHNKKGPVVTTAVLAGICGAKKTADLIPLCHPVALEDCDVSVEYERELSRLRLDCIVRTSGKTGVEMEALVGLSTAALCVYDMCKGLSHDITITELKLMSKTGGKNDFIREKG